MVSLTLLRRTDPFHFFFFVDLPVFTQKLSLTYFRRFV